MPAGGEDPVISAERAHLTRSREFLRLMREHVLANNPMAGDPVSLEYLKADLYRRAEALKDIPDAPLFFGRLDYSELAKDEDSRRRLPHRKAPRARPGRDPGRHRLARPRLTALLPRQPGRPDGPRPPAAVRVLRGELTAYEDEIVHSHGGVQEPGAYVPKKKRPATCSSRKSSGRDPARCATSSPPSSPTRTTSSAATRATTVCVQGAPGTGKTAVGLHRVAYLLYAHKEQVTRRGVIVVGRTSPFSPTSGTCCPRSANSTSPRPRSPTWWPRSRRAAPTATRRPGQGRRADGRACCAARSGRRSGRPPSRSSCRADHGAGGCPRTRSRSWPRSCATAASGTGRAGNCSAHRIAHVILTRMEAAGETCDDRTHDSVRRSAPVRACVDQVWPKVDAKRLVFGLLSSAANLATHADGLLSAAEQQAIAGRCRRAAPAPPGGAAPTRCSSTRRPTSSSARRASRTWWWTRRRTCRRWSAGRSGGGARPGRRPCSATSRRAPRPWAATSWPALLGHLGKPDAAVRELDVGYRVPRQILDYASRLLPSIAPELRPGRRHCGRIPDR